MEKEQKGDRMKILYKILTLVYGDGKPKNMRKL